MTTPPSPLWDTKQLAEHLGMSPRYIGRLVKESRIPFTRLGRSLRFKPDDIETWLATRSHGPVR